MSAGRRLPRSESKERFWRTLVDGFDSQQTSIRQWCEQHAVSQASFYAWRRKLQRRVPDSGTLGNDTRPQLLPVQITPANPTTTPRVIVWQRRLRLHVPLSQLREVLDLLESRTC
jgi:transposase-like protein